MPWCAWWRATARPLTEQVQAAELEFAIVPAFSGAPGLKSRLFLRTPEVLVSSPPSPPPASGARAARRSRTAQAGGAEQGQHAPPPDRDLSRLQRRRDRAPARARRHAGHARFRGAHGLDGDPAGHHDGERDALAPVHGQPDRRPVLRPRPGADRAVAAAHVAGRAGLPRNARGGEHPPQPALGKERRSARASWVGIKDVQISPGSSGFRLSSRMWTIHASLHVSMR